MTPGRAPLAAAGGTLCTLLPPPGSPGGGGSGGGGGGRGFPDVAEVVHHKASYFSRAPPGSLPPPNRFSAFNWGFYASTAGAIWGGVLALANAHRLAAGAPTLGLVAPALYATARALPSAFTDITRGNNSCSAACCGQGYSAGVGWDAVTGLGSPRADLLVPALAALYIAPSSSRTPSPTPSPSSTLTPTPFPAPSAFYTLTLISVPQASVGNAGVKGALEAGITAALPSGVGVNVTRMVGSGGGVDGMGNASVVFSIAVRGGEGAAAAAAAAAVAAQTFCARVRAGSMAQAAELGLPSTLFPTTLQVCCAGALSPQAPELTPTPASALGASLLPPALSPAQIVGTALGSAVGLVLCCMGCTRVRARAHAAGSTGRGKGGVGSGRGRGSTLTTPRTPPTSTNGSSLGRGHRAAAASEAALALAGSTSPLAGLRGHGSGPLGGAQSGAEGQVEGAVGAGRAAFVVREAAPLPPPSAGEKSGRSVAAAMPAAVVSAESEPGEHLVLL